MVKTIEDAAGKKTAPPAPLPGEIQTELSDDARKAGGPKAQRTRRSIMRAGLQLFGEQGYRRTTMTDVAVAAGVAQGTVYQYFRDRADLVVAIINRGVHDLVTRTDPTFRVAEGTAGLERILTNYARSYADTPELVKVWEEVSHVDERVAEVRRSIGRVFESAVAKELRNGQRRRLIRRDVDPADAARALSAMADRYCYLTYVFDPPASGPPEAEAVGRLLARLWATGLEMSG